MVITDLLTAETRPIYPAELDGLTVQVVRLLPSLAEAQRRNRARGLWVAPARVAALYAQQAALDGVGETLDTTALPAAVVADRLAPLLGGSSVGAP